MALPKIFCPSLRWWNVIVARHCRAGERTIHAAHHPSGLFSRKSRRGRTTSAGRVCGAYCVSNTGCSIDRLSLGLRIYSTKIAVPIEPRIPMIAPIIRANMKGPPQRWHSTMTATQPLVYSSANEIGSSLVAFRRLCPVIVSIWKRDRQVLSVPSSIVIGIRGSVSVLRDIPITRG